MTTTSSRFVLSAERIAVASIALALCACDTNPLLTDRDAGPGSDASVPVDAARGDAGPPQVDAGPPCRELDPVAPANPTDGEWDRRFANPGVGGDLPNVEAIAFGADDVVYVGGDFTTAGYVPARSVAVWDGETGWRAMGEGLDGRVVSLAVAPDGRVYAAYAPGNEWQATRIARWDGTSWSMLAESEGSIEELAFVGTELFAVGGFTSIGGVALNGVAHWNGTTWTGYAGIEPDGSVQAISATSLNDVCVGGQFGTLGVVASRGAACWNGTTWLPRPLPLEFYTGIEDMVRDPSDGSLVAVGNFMLAENTTDGGSVARWVSDRWELIGGGVMSELGPGTTQPATGVVFAPSGMYVAGAFDLVDPADPRPVNSVARWREGRWDDLGGLFMEVGVGLGFNNVNVTAVGPDGSVYFGGLFTRAGSVRVGHVVRYDGNYWSALRTPGERYEGIGGEVLALSRHGTCAVYVGGNFEYAGEVRANSIARYTREGGYEALADGVVGVVQDIAAFDDGRVVIGGGFSDSTGTAFQNVALWDGVRWNALGGSIDGMAWAVAIEPSGSPDVPDRIYAGGQFTTVESDTVARGVAVWTGERWSEVGGGLGGYRFPSDPKNESDAYPYDLLVDPETGDLVVAGRFHHVGDDDLVVNNIARWDGTAWHAYGAGLGDGFGSVMGITWWNGALVAVGSFDHSGETEVGHVARWNGTAWEAIGAVDAFESYGISAVEAAGDALFVGGVFDLVGSPSTHVAVFRDGAWRDLRAGASDLVEALVAMDEGVYFGGAFDRTGTAPSVGLALWRYNR